MSYLITCSRCKKEKVLNNPEKFENQDVSYTCKCGNKVIHKVILQTSIYTDVISKNSLIGKKGYLNLLNSDKEPIKNYILALGETKIGRASDKIKTDITLPEEDKTLSRKHCKILGNYSIKREIMEYIICDWESKNGIYINNKELSPDEKIYLNHGDIIQLGKTYLKFEMI